MEDWGMMELDILKEIGSVAANYSTNALTKMLNKEIKVLMPSILPFHDDNLLRAYRGKHDSFVSVQCDILSGLNGKLLLTFDSDSAAKFMSICYPGYHLSEGTTLTELGMSALKEIGNIVLSAYVTALSVFLRTIIVPSPPDLTVGSSDEILKSISNCGKVFILLIDAVFEREQEKIAGRIEFLLTRGDKDLVQKFCRESLQNNNLPHVDDLGADFGGTFGPLGN